MSLKRQQDEYQYVHVSPFNRQEGNQCTRIIHSVECKVKRGPVSVLGLTQQADGKLKFLMSEGESIADPTFRIGNTNSRIRFALDAATFITRWSEAGPTHHMALGIGAIAPLLEKVGYLLDVKMVRIG